MAKPATFSQLPFLEGCAAMSPQLPAFSAAGGTNVCIAFCVVHRRIPYNDVRCAILLLSICRFEIFHIFSNLSIKIKNPPISRYFSNYSSSTHTHTHTPHNINPNSNIWSHTYYLFFLWQLEMPFSLSLLVLEGFAASERFQTDG